MNTTQKDIEIIRSWACSPIVGEKVKQALAKLIKENEALAYRVETFETGMYLERDRANKAEDELQAKLKRSSMSVDQIGNAIVKAQKEHDKLCGKWSEDNPKPITLFKYIAIELHKLINAVQPMSVEEMSKYTVDLVEQNFPKGRCKERGKAIVLHAQMLLAIHNAINTKEK